MAVPSESQSSEVNAEVQRLAAFNMESMNPQQQDLIRRSMTIGSVSAANQHYNRRTNSQTDELRNQGQDTFVTPTFFNSHLTSQLANNQAVTGGQLPMFGTRTAIANAEQIGQNRTPTITSTSVGIVFRSEPNRKGQPLCSIFNKFNFKDHYSNIRRNSTFTREWPTIRSTKNYDENNAICSR